MVQYQCSSCHRQIGRFIDPKGEPIVFLCPHSGRPATAEERRVG